MKGVLQEERKTRKGNDQPVNDEVPKGNSEMIFSKDRMEIVELGV